MYKPMKITDSKCKLHEREDEGKETKVIYVECWNQIKIKFGFISKPYQSHDWFFHYNLTVQLR